MNTVQLIGRLTADVDLRYTQNGTAVGNFTLAVNKRIKQDNGPDADFIRCVIWQKAAEALAQYQKKGSLIAVVGSIETGSYEDKDGKTVYTTEVNVRETEFLTPKSQNNQGGNQGNPYNQGNQGGGQQNPYNQGNQQGQGNQGNQGGGQMNPYQFQNNQNQGGQPQGNNQGQPLDISDKDLPF